MNAVPTTTSKNKRINPIMTCSFYCLLSRSRGPYRPSLFEPQGPAEGLVSIVNSVDPPAHPGRSFRSGLRPLLARAIAHLHILYVTYLPVSHCHGPMTWAERSEAHAIELFHFSRFVVCASSALQANECCISSPGRSSISNHIIRVCLCASTSMMLAVTLSLGFWSPFSYSVLSYFSLAFLTSITISSCPTATARLIADRLRPS